MADKKELPVNGGLFFPYGQSNVVANANGSQASSSNFNPLVAAAGFNPMAAGYPGATFYSSPFSMLPFAAAVAASAPNSAPFLNTHGPPTNPFSAGFPPQANPLWPGLLPPDYLLNVAALQSLQQPGMSVSMIDSGGETFSDILKKMPKASACATVDDASNPRISSSNTSSLTHDRIPSTAASNSSSSKTASCTAIKRRSVVTSVETSNAAPRASSSTASSFSATSLAISDQKLASPSSSSSTISGSGGDLSSLHQHHHSSSLATLAEIASSLQNNDGYEPRTVAHSEQKLAVKKEATGSNSDAVSPAVQPIHDHAKQQRSGNDGKRASSNDGRSTKLPTNATGPSVLDFSRKRPWSKTNSATTENGDVVRRKEPKLEHVESPTSHTASNSKVVDQQQAKRDEKEHRHSRHRQEPSSANDTAAAAAAAAAATLFGASLSSDLKMDPNLLNASAMAWAALSNQWLFANVQNEILNRAAAAALRQPQASSTAPRSGSSRSQNSSKASSAAPAESNFASSTLVKKARVHQRNDNDSSNRRSSRGRPATISISGLSSQQSAPAADNKDAVDVTIDAVIKQQQEEMASSTSTRRSRKTTPAGRSKRGRGSRGGITVREQLAARRRNRLNAAESLTASIAGKSGPILNGCSTDKEGAATAKVTAKETEEKLTSKELAAPQIAALDLSVKHNARQTPSKSVKSSDTTSSSASTMARIANSTVYSNGTDQANNADDVDDSATFDDTLTRKRRVPEAHAVRLPLTKGWRRQTYVRSMSSNCVRGDVIYYAPCGKRLGSYAEVVRYLNRHDIRDIDRDNFSFSCKVLVGEFLHVKSDGGKNGVVKLTEKELRDLLSKMHLPVTSDRADGRKVHSAVNRCGDRSRRRGLSTLTRRNSSRRSTAMPARFGQAATSDGRKKDASVSAQSAAEHTRQVWETKRLERERESQLFEHERKRKLDFMRNQKVMEAMQRAKEKEIRQQHMESVKRQEEQYMQQMAILANMEREKVRQQMLFSRALEARRRQEEKERLYAEKLIRREERLAARTAALMKLRQMRQPCEDMEIEDCKELPALSRMENMKLDGQAFADLLMVMEFINNFGHVLKIDKTEIPSIGEVHAGLLNDHRHVQSLRSLVKTLLLLVLEYPGLPAGNSGKTILGQPAKDVGVTDMNMSELLRMFLLSRDEQSKDLGNELNNQPYEALSPSRKAAVLAYMCNELLYCRNVVREIEGNIDVIAKLKSDRWALEGKIRHMKVVQASKRKGEKIDDSAKEAIGSDTAASTSSSLIDKSPPATMKLHEEDDEEGDSSDSDAKMDGGNQEAGCSGKRTPKTLFGITAGEIESISKEEKLMTAEEVDKELDGLRKEMHDLRSRVSEVSVRVRASPFGQDRYSRYYWILPHYSGVLVEGVESGGVHNPAVKYGSHATRLPSPHASGGSVSSPKYADDVRYCVQDMMETVFRSNLTDYEMDLGRAYAEVKLERSNLTQEVEANAELSKAAALTRTASTKTPGSKKMKPIPLDMQQGWWLINDPEQLDAMPPHLHHRGIRERQLSRLLTKHGDHVTRVAFQPGKIAIKFNPVDARGESEPTAMTLRSARRLLNMMRQLEEKVFHANVHVRGWKPTDVAPESTPPQSVVDSGASSDSSCDSMLDAKDRYAAHNTDELLTVVKDRLLRLELNIERRYFMPAFNRDTNKVCATSSNTPTALLNLSADKDETLKSEGDCSRPSDSQNSASEEPEAEEEEDDGEDEVPLALERWRGGVGRASNIAQLSMCLEELDAQVAWEKSVMKASCQICRGGDNESQLLLCDGCDLGYHTYCFKPKLETVPEGDWFCPECIAKATRRPCCLLCCRQASRPMIACTECSKNFHLDCLPGPVKKTRSGAWTCGGCCNSKVPGKHTKATSADVQCASSMPSTPTSDSTPSKKRSSKKSLPSVKNGARSSPSVSQSSSGPLKFHELCSIMLAELDAHKDAGPFRTPVDTKGCPLYKKIIKQPMDLSTIQSKLTNKKYEKEQQFVSDVKLMFDNCRTFNEDDSPIGKSGHALRRYFTKRWKELKESNGKKSS